jgi:hypothetical protein
LLATFQQQNGLTSQTLDLLITTIESITGTNNAAWMTVSMDLISKLIQYNYFTIPVVHGGLLWIDRIVAIIGNSFHGEQTDEKLLHQIFKVRIMVQAALFITYIVSSDHSLMSSFNRTT